MKKLDLIIESKWNLIFNVPPFEVWAVWSK